MTVPITDCMTPADRELYDRGDLLISSCDIDVLRSMGFRKWNNPVTPFVYICEIPDTHRFRNHLAVGGMDEPRVFGLVTGLMSTAGYKAFEFKDFCDRVYFRKPNGDYDNDLAVRHVMDLVHRMIDSGAIKLEVEE